MKPEEIISTQEREIQKLKAALKEIEQMSDSGSYVQAIIRMKDIASKALTRRKKFTHPSHIERIIKNSISCTKKEFNT